MNDSTPIGGRSDREVKGSRVGDDPIRLFISAQERLACSLDRRSTLETFGSLLVPGLADRCFIDLIEEDGTFTRFCIETSEEGIASSIASHPFSAIESILDRTVAGDIVVSSSSEESFDTLLHPDSIPTGTAAALALVPLDARGRRVGIVRLIRTDPDASFSEGDLDLVLALARCGALALEDIRIIETAREGSDEERGTGDEVRGRLERLLEQMQKIEVRVRRLFEANVIGIVFGDVDGRLYEANDAYLGIIGYSREDMEEGRISWRDLTLPEYGPRVRSAIEEMTRLGICTPFEEELVRKDGSRVPVMVGSAMIEGSESNAVSFVIDLSERKRAEKALRDSEGRMRALLDAIPDLIFRLDYHGTLIDAMASDESDLAVPPAEFIGRPVDEVLPGDVGRLVREKIALAAASAKMQMVEYTLPMPGGEHYYEARIVPSAEGEMLAIVRDITDRKLSERELRSSERRFRALFENSWDGIWLIGADMTVQYASSSATRILGYEREEMVGRTILDLLHPDDVDTIRASFNELIATTERVITEYRCRHLDGSWRWLEGSGVNLMDDPAVRSIVGNFRDISERKKAEEELRMRARQQAVVADFGQRALAGEDIDLLMEESVNIAADVLDVELTKVLELMPDGKRLLIRNGIGWNKGIVGSAFVPVEYNSQAGYTLLSSEPVIVEDLRSETRFEGTYILHEHGVVSGISVIIHSTERPFGIFGVHTPRRRRFTQDDINFLQSIANILGEAVARKRAETALERAKDVAEGANAAKDQFLAVLSHELRTPLTPVLAAVEALGHGEDLSNEARSYLDIIHRNVELEARLIDDLLDLTRISRGKLQLNRDVVDVHIILHHVEEICLPEAREKGLRLTMDLSAEEHHADVDPARIQQVFWNLLQNAVKFTPAGGSITVRTSNPEPGRVRIEVIDTGIGIEPDIIPRIFNAFEQGEQTITRRFGGLGLGLAISRMLMTAHGGALDAFSAGRGQGATFTVEIDVAQPRNGLRPDGDIMEEQENKPAVHILLVDDHADTSMVMKLLLERRGFRVTTANSVRTAIEAATREPIDLLVSDIGLPDGSGLDIMRELKSRGPLPGIALSGFGMEEDIKRSKEAGFDEHLTKPITFQTLAQAIGNILDTTV